MQVDFGGLKDENGESSKISNIIRKRIFQIMLFFLTTFFFISSVST